MNSTDRIEKHVLLKATQSRVWRALTDSAEFGSWFQAKFEMPFKAGQRAVGQITHAGYEHLRIEVFIERMDAQHLLSFRWHPYAVDPAVDYSAEPTTLVEFKLAEATGGTLLTVCESGFDRIPAERRAEAFRMNSQGWAAQLENIERHVAA
jgi:uncharacterized protein YndB with AHSA1/START domain